MTRNASVGACLIVASIFTPIQGGSATVYSNLCRYAPKGRMVALATRRERLAGSATALARGLARSLHAGVGNVAPAPPE